MPRSCAGEELSADPAQCAPDGVDRYDLVDQVGLFEDLVFEARGDQRCEQLATLPVGREHEERLTLGREHTAEPGSEALEHSLAAPGVIQRVLRDPAVERRVEQHEVERPAPYW